MAVYIANFGEQNYEWPECRKRGTIATMNEVGAFDFWRRADREGYIQNRMKGQTAAGRSPTRAVASRWFNLMTIIDQTENDLWIHRDGARLWWTRSTTQPSTFEPRTEMVGRKRDVIICHKPCLGWRSVDGKGATLLWDAMHPKARDFLSTEATLQKLSEEYGTYAVALIKGDDLRSWHSSAKWQTRLGQARKVGAVVFNNVQLAAARMARAAFETAGSANGQQVSRTLKNKEVLFPDIYALEKYIYELLEMQEHQCAITGLYLNYDRLDDDRELFPSLDRIDSSGHYQDGNLQVVCRFINRWKGASDNEEFRRLIALLA